MHILFFAQIKDAAGLPALDLAIPGEVTADELWHQLVLRHPALEPFQKTTRLARNGEYVQAGARFSDADEVALIPPVSGG